MATCLSILVIEDHDELRASTVEVLAAQGHRVVGVASAEDVTDHAHDLQPELYLIDINLPGEDGISLARRLRAAQPAVGIIMFTARTRLADKLAGYDGGADLYLPKPVDPDELISAITALARRIRGTQVSADDTLRLTHSRLRLAGPAGETGLSAAEARLLDALAKSPEQRLERWQIIAALGMAPQALSDSALEVRIATVRRKLREVGAGETALKAVRGVGYQLCATLRVD